MQLAEKSNQVDVLTQQTLDAENEVQVLKRKHASTLRELTRELQAAVSSSANYSTTSNHHHRHPNNLQQVGSSSSLKEGENNNQHQLLSISGTSNAQGMCL